MLIVTHTLQNGKGIGNNSICETLWPDKNHESAQNNRRVSIYKLKSLMEKTGDIELVNDNAYLSIHFGQESFCDYKAVLDAIMRLRNSQEIDSRQLLATLSLVALGKPLPAISNQWIDVFKADYATCVQDTLLGIVNGGSLSDTRTLIRIADILFMFDSTDETAIRIKCRALVKEGKTGMAKKAFDSFCAEYIELLGTPYDKSFRETVAD